MGEVGDDPMTGDTDRNPHGDSPHRPAWSSDPVQGGGQRDLMKWPRRFHEAIPGISGEVRLDRECRRAGEPEAAMKLPERIHPRRWAKKSWARTLALGPVPDVMNLQDPERPGHPHEHAQPDKEALEWFAALERSVNQASVHAQRMTKHQRRVAEPREHGQCAPAEVERAERDRDRIHRCIP